jgi:hypothetical protein
VVQRARLLARTKLILDLLLAISFFLRDAPWPFLAAVAVDVVLAWPYLRFVQRAPAMATLATLTLTTVLLALAPYALETAGLAAWVLLPLAPLAAAYALSRRRQLWQMAAIATLIVTAAATIALLQVQLPLQVEVIATDPASYLATALAAIAGIWAASWLVSHAFGAESKSQALLGAPLTVVRHVMVAPLRWVVGGVAKDALQQELHDLRRQHAPQWIVLDLGAAGELGRHDLQAVEQAAAAITNPNCSVVLARSPVDALGHMDFAQSLVGRVERFATVPQAVEAGLRRLGWSQNAEQAQRVVTTY